MSGLEPGDHGFHVHTWGNVGLPNGTAVSGHFIGTCNATNPCRPGASLQEIGLLFDGAKVTAATDGTATAMRFDGVAPLSGPNSIIGRAIIVHSSVTPSKYAAQVWAMGCARRLPL
jgi:Cu-Zn family superoxide dismutase